MYYYFNSPLLRELRFKSATTLNLMNDEMQLQRDFMYTPKVKQFADLQHYFSFQKGAFNSHNAMLSK